MNYDIIIAGGGIMGCSIAYHLKKYDPKLQILVIERDSSYEKSSTLLSDGNTRIQFNLKEASMEQIKAFQKATLDRGLLVELFGDTTNARYFKNWEFAPADCELPQTERIIKSTLDMRMPLTWEDSDFDDMYNVLVESMTDAGILN